MTGHRRNQDLRPIHPMKTNPLFRVRHVHGASHLVAPCPPKPDKPNDIEVEKPKRLRKERGAKDSIPTPPTKRKRAKKRADTVANSQSYESAGEATRHSDSKPMQPLDDNFVNAAHLANIVGFFDAQASTPEHDFEYPL